MRFIMLYIIALIITVLIVRKILKRKNPVMAMVDENLNKRFGASNARILSTLNPAVREKFKAFLNDIVKMGYGYALTEGFRTYDQSVYFKKQDPHNATPGYSAHNYGIALDLVLYKDGKMIGKGNQYYQAWVDSGVPKLAKEKYGMRWGGDFPGYKDEVHFDYSNRYDVNKLYAAAVKEFGSPEKIRGNELDLSKV